MERDELGTMGRDEPGTDILSLNTQPPRHQQPFLTYSVLPGFHCFFNQSVI